MTLASMHSGILYRPYQHGAESTLHTDKFGKKISVCFVYYTLLVVQFLTTHVPKSSGEIVGAFVLPHGGIALDPSHFNTTNSTVLKEAWAVHDAAVGVGQAIGELKPDIVFLSTPHGVADLNRFILYLNPTGFGTADTDNCQCPPCCYNVSVNIDNVLALSLAHQLETANIEVGGLSAFGPPGGVGQDFPLRWGEVVPLHFLTSDLDALKVVILSQPSRRYNQTLEMIPELLDLGSHLSSIMSMMAKRIVILVSADLAHTHDKYGPYGFSTAAAPFDKACGQWASSLDEYLLLETAAKYVDKALSCGYTGLVMVHGLLRAEGLEKWDSTLHANYHPSYYGMMVASFNRRK